MIDEGSLNEFIRRFFGYGSWDAALWFIGMEEGGGESMEEIEKRLMSWDRSDELADLKEFHSAIGGTDWFAQHPTIQSTWGKLIRIALASRRLATDTESVRNYQRDRLGRRTGDVALIELLPLPSPSTSHWLYETLGIASVRTREQYREAALPHRIEAIRHRLQKHRPPAVVFYGIGYREHWEEIAGAHFQPADKERFEIVHKDNTLFVLAPHPVARGVRNADFEAIGAIINRQ